MRLRREHVVDEAIALLDADGLDALTMRKLATRLGVQAGALYWHFASKQALLANAVREVHRKSQQVLKDQGWTDSFSTGDEFSSFLDDESKRVQDVLSGLGLA